MCTRYYCSATCNSHQRTVMSNRYKCSAMYNRNQCIVTCKRSRTEAIAKYTTPNKRVWKLPTSTQLRATWHTDSLDMVVLPSTGVSRYHNCCIDGGTSPEYFGCTLEHVLHFNLSSSKPSHMLKYIWFMISCSMLLNLHSNSTLCVRTTSPLYVGCQNKRKCSCLRY
jgi:hypothetical protein